MIEPMLFEILDALADKIEKEAYYGPGERLFGHGDEVGAVFLLDAGEVKLSRALPENRELVLQRVRGPAILAEASLYRERYDCDALCLSDCRVRNLSAARFLSLIEESAVLSSAWAAHLAQSLQEASVRVEILKLKTARERLDAWLAFRDAVPPEKQDLSALAGELGVTPATLSRELARRKR